MNEPDEGWTVRELADDAGTTVRTIHYYVSEGLLPPPAGATRSASYSAAHLARLRLIAALRDEGLSLASIRQRLAPISEMQALEIAAELDEHLARGGDTPLSTLGLIEAALATRVATDEAHDAAPPPAPSASLMEPHASVEFADIRQASIAPLDRPRESAGEYLNRVLRKPETRPAPTPRPKPPRKPSDSERPEAWYHFRIEDGIELRVREDRYRESRGRLMAVIDTMRSALRRYGMSPGEPDRD